MADYTPVFTGDSPAVHVDDLAAVTGGQVLIVTGSRLVGPATARVGSRRRCRFERRRERARRSPCGPASRGPRDRHADRLHRRERPVLGCRWHRRPRHPRRPRRRGHADRRRPLTTATAGKVPVGLPQLTRTGDWGMPGTYPQRRRPVRPALLTISRFLSSPAQIVRRVRDSDLRFVADQVLTQSSTRAAVPSSGVQPFIVGPCRHRRLPGSGTRRGVPLRPPVSPPSSSGDRHRPDRRESPAPAPAPPRTEKLRARQLGHRVEPPSP